jgi:hypothetical protein
MLVFAACNSAGDGSEPTTAPPETSVTTPPTTQPTTSTTEAPHDEFRTLAAPAAAITVDGDGSDWADIAGSDVMLEPIEGKDFEPKAATVKVAHDGEFLYVLYTVEDDYDYTEGDPHLSGSPSVMWAIESGAGPHMGTEAEDGEGPSLGMVDIWHWELECGPGENQGGAVAGPGDGKDPGNDSGCNFDDEWATDPETREDDNGAGAENSLLGVFHHTSESNGDAGVWTFEMRRTLQTGDVQDAQFTVGGTGLLALAYWDADNSPEGWDDADHVQSSHDGWIEVALMRS